MKKVILLFFVCVVTVVSASAQKTATKKSVSPAEKAKIIVAKMSAACNLKPEQAEKVSKAYLDYYTKHDALKKQKDILDKSSYEDRKDAMKKTRDAVIKSTLTAGQYKQWVTAKDKEKKEAKKDKQEE